MVVLLGDVQEAETAAHCIPDVHGLHEHSCPAEVSHSGVVSQEGPDTRLSTSRQGRPVTRPDHELAERQLPSAEKQPEWVRFVLDVLERERRYHTPPARMRSSGGRDELRVARSDPLANRGFNEFPRRRNCLGSTVRQKPTA